MGDDLNGGRPMEDHINGRQPKWNTTKMDDDLHRREIIIDKA